jgi:hypothetical protein
MHFSLRVFALSTASAMFACSTLPASASGLSGFAGAAGARVEVGGVPRGGYGARDMGRRAPLALVTGTVTLRYNHQAELDALVRAQSEPGSALYQHFLTSAQFDAYFAPTAAQQAAAIAALRAGGLNVTHTYSNRTLLDIAGTSVAAERFFGTEIHSLSQGRYGERFSNVRPVTLPAGLAQLVRSVDLSNLVVANSAPHIRPGVAHHASRVAAAKVPATTAPPNFVADSGFESGGLKAGWVACGSGKPAATVQSAVVHRGKYAGKAGSTSTTSGEPNGYAGLCQLVKIPRNGVLAAYLYQLSNEPNTTNAAQEVLLQDSAFNTVATLKKTVTNQAGWDYYRWNLAQYAGRQLYISFGVEGNGNASHYTMQYVDDVTLTAASNTTCQDSPDAGPFSDDNGFLATAVADAFDFPVQYGCSGTGTTLAIVIDSPVEPQDISDYLTDAGVKQTGTINTIKVDGGGTYSSDPNSATGEAVLDVETVSGLAPGADVLIYDIPDLTDQSINDAYNQAISDNKASVVNSSFGGCEAQDVTGSRQTDALAEQGAAKGITFAASSGDDGSDECNTGNKPPGPSAPASDPYFVAVGSVNFTQNALGNLTSITSAMDGTFLSGGGVSTVWDTPGYQLGIANVLKPGRNTPDIALPGVDVAVWQAGNEGAADGTSWSCPQFVALVAEAAQIHGGNKRFGWLTPTMYSFFKKSGYATDYTDVKTGNNGYYSAKAGYDQVTGIGAPVGMMFANDI